MGPTLFIHLPQSLTREEIEALHNWLSRTTHSLKRQVDAWEFQTDNDTCLCSLAIVPFGAESAGDGQVTDIHLSVEERAEYEEKLGYVPSTSLQLDNYCRSDKKGHEQLTKMSILLTRKHDGVINVGRAVDIFISGAKSSGRHLPGRWHVVTVAGIRDEYLVDAEFMEQWVNDSEFHLEI